MKKAWTGLQQQTVPILFLPKAAILTNVPASPKSSVGPVLDSATRRMALEGFPLTFSREVTYAGRFRPAKDEERPQKTDPPPLRQPKSVVLVIRIF